MSENRIKQWRTQNHVTLFDMSKAVGCSVLTVRMWENDISTPAPENQKKLDAVLSAPWINEEAGD